MGTRQRRVSATDCHRLQNRTTAAPQRSRAGDPSQSPVQVSRSLSALAAPGVGETERRREEASFYSASAPRVARHAGSRGGRGTRSCDRVSLLPFRARALALSFSAAPGGECLLFRSRVCLCSCLGSINSAVSFCCDAFRPILCTDRAMCIRYDVYRPECTILPVRGRISTPLTTCYRAGPLRGELGHVHGDTPALNAQPLGTGRPISNSPPFFPKHPQFSSSRAPPLSSVSAQ
ncbi:hypothetical protein C8Q78DRAFT_760371 [Trametes maxima]|nr:hypothetical protein C8Q78DRAFT_760371 [Trametes maxima]